MKLKRLELVGFKSFADRTVFDFTHGFTGIVGPNGCGKSNVVDAFKWIMGEQSAKSLRGSEMQDVIFSGTSHRKQMGFAEASLCFSEVEGILDDGSTDITISRRLYRSGESEYLINKQTSRLKDIREMFFGTGMGRDAYSIIEQGKIDRVLSLNPKDRRVVLEEAAGIMRYKVKKDEAVRRLGRVQDNLDRLKDILDEVASRTRSVKIQAGKARRFKEYNERLDILREAYSVHRYRELDEEHVELENDLAEKTRAAAADREKADALAESIHASEEEYSRLEDEVREKRDELSRLEAEKSGLDEKRASNARRAEETRAALERLDAATDELTERISELEKEEAGLSGRVEEMALEISGKREELAGVEEKASSLGREELDIRSEIEKKKAEAFECITSQSEYRNNLSALESEEKLLASRAARLDERAGEVLSSRDAAEREADNLLAGAAYHEAVLADATENLDALDAEAGELAGRRKGLEVNASALAEKYTELTARRDVLEGMVTRLEGVTSGTRKLREMKEEDPSGWEGMRGIVAELLDVAPEHAAAVEAALGSYAEALVFDDADHAAEARAVLLESASGKATFINVPPLAVKEDGRGLEESSDVRRISSLVNMPEELDGVLDHVLGDAVLVEDFETASRLRSEGFPAGRFVTKTGEVVTRLGDWVGGAGAEEAGLLSRRGELTTLSAEIDATGRKLDSLKSDAARLARAEEAVIHEKTLLAEEARDAESRIRDLSKAADDRRRERDAFAREAAVIEEELSSVRSDLEGLSERRAELTEKLREAEELGRRLSGEVENLEKRIEEVRSEKESLAESLENMKAELASLNEKAGNLRTEKARVEYELSEKRGRLGEIETEKADLSRRIEESEKAVAACEESLAEATGKIEIASDIANELDEKRVQARRSVDEGRAEAAGLEKAARESARLADKAGLAEKEVLLKIESLVERFAEENDRDLAEIAANSLADEIEVDENDEEIVPLQFDWKWAKKEIEELRRKRDKIGSVNLDALDELSELEERLEFLTAQYEDLDKAKNQLQDVIRKINKKTRSMFVETYDTVRANFQVLFRKLFGGGKADIVLEEDVDVLEAGVEIMAKPPGKENRSISLLSGGEKVMTTVALVFAIFKSRPSPVCILDEVDAALDDANVQRFLAMLDDFLSESQFLIITHNKNTMARADALYGVTMPEVGVSRLVVMEFEEAIKHAKKPEKSQQAA